MHSFEVVINSMLGTKNSYGYYAGEIYQVIDYTAVSYQVVSPKEKAGWQIYHAHCKKVQE